MIHLIGEPSFLAINQGKTQGLTREGDILEVVTEDGSSTGKPIRFPKLPPDVKGPKGPIPAVVVGTAPKRAGGKGLLWLCENLADMQQLWYKSHDNGYPPVQWWTAHMIFMEDFRTEVDPLELTVGMGLDVAPVTDLTNLKAVVVIAITASEVYFELAESSWPEQPEQVRQLHAMGLPVTYTLRTSWTTNGQLVARSHPDVILKFYKPDK